MKNHRGRMAGAFGAALLTAIASGSATATVQVFEGLDNSFIANGAGHPNADAARAAFEAEAGVLLVQSFDDLTPGAAPATLVAPFGASLAATASGYVNIADAPSAFDTFATAGRFLDALGANGSTYFTFTFDIPTRAIGFDISDASDWFGDSRDVSNLMLTLLTSVGSTELRLFSGTDPHDMVSGNFGFFGVVSNAQNLLGFSITNPLGNPDADAIGLDNLSVSIEPVPLPGAAWMLVPALAGMIGVGRRRPASA